MCNEILNFICAPIRILLDWCKCNENEINEIHEYESSTWRRNHGLYDRGEDMIERKAMSTENLHYKKNEISYNKHKEEVVLPRVYCETVTRISNKFILDENLENSKTKHQVDESNNNINKYCFDNAIF